MSCVEVVVPKSVTGRGYYYTKASRRDLGIRSVKGSPLSEGHQQVLALRRGRYLIPLMLTRCRHPTFAERAMSDPVTFSPIFPFTLSSHLDNDHPSRSPVHKHSLSPHTKSTTMSDAGSPPAAEQKPKAEGISPPSFP